MFNEVFFDVETKKLFEEIETNNPGDLGVSIVSVYVRKIDKEMNELEGEMMSFWEDDFPKMWDFFSTADRIIGFNTLHFDVPAMQPYASFNFSKLKHFDIMTHVKEAFGRRVSLNAIAKDTIGNVKIDKGTNAVKYWNKGDEESLAKLRKYCEADVMITKDIYDFGMKNRKLKFTDHWNTAREIEVNFAYPDEVLNGPRQVSLF